MIFLLLLWSSPSPLPRLLLCFLLYVNAITIMGGCREESEALKSAEEEVESERRVRIEPQRSAS